MTQLELKIPPLAVWLVHVMSIAAAAYWLPTASFAVPGHRVAGVAVMLGGIWMGIAGVVAFRRVKTTVNPLTPGRATSVVTTGVYRLTRNPMYAGMAAGLLGLAMWWASLAGVLLVGVFCAYITRFQIQPEERALLAQFGDAFSNYMSRVRCWI